MQVEQQGRDRAYFSRSTMRCPFLVLDETCLLTCTSSTSPMTIVEVILPSLQDDSLLTDLELVTNLLAVLRLSRNMFLKFQGLNYLGNLTCTLDSILQQTNQSEEIKVGRFKFYENVGISKTQCP